MAVSKAKTKIKVLNDFYLVEPFQEEITQDKQSGLTEDVVSAIKSGKLIIPEIADKYVKKRPMKGKVITWGDKCKYAGDEIVAGDTIYFGYYCYAKVKHGGKEYFELREYDILAVEKDEIICYEIP